MSAILPTLDELKDLYQEYNESLDEKNNTENLAKVGRVLREAAKKGKKEVFFILGPDQAVYYDSNLPFATEVKPDYYTLKTVTSETFINMIVILDSVYTSVSNTIVYSGGNSWPAMRVKNDL